MERISDDAWQRIAPFLEDLPRRKDGRGRPFRPARDVFDGVLWVLRTGAQWKALPDEYPPYQTCHRRFQRWAQDGRLEQAVRELAKELHWMEQLGTEMGFLDGSFASAKKGASASAKRSEEKAQK